MALTENGNCGLGKAPDLMALVNAGLMSQAVYVAAELGIADLLADGPKEATELARATGSHTASMHRFLRALASLGLCTERDDGVFALGAIGAPLRGDARNSLRSWIIWNGNYMWPVWGKLSDSLKAGKSVQQLAGGNNGFDRLTRDPQAAAAFNSAMGEITRLIADEVIRAYDFAPIRKIVDVGGGHGALLAAILKAHPHMTGTLFDMSHAVAGARAYLSSEGVADRSDVVAGNFFESVPAQTATYLLKNIIHDWSDEQSTAILRNCRRAISPDERLLIVEQITPGRLEASPAHRTLAWIDLAMMVGPGVLSERKHNSAIFLQCPAFGSPERSTPRWDTASSKAFRSRRPSWRRRNAAPTSQPEIEHGTIARASFDLVPNASRCPARRRRFAFARAATAHVSPMRSVAAARRCFGSDIGSVISISTGTARSGDLGLRC